jgi:nucleoporin POM152
LSSRKSFLSRLVHSNLLTASRYIRSSNAAKGKKSEVLDIKHDISYENIKTIKTSDEGTYEVIAIKDKFCSFSSQTTPSGKSK